jgi:hypothetical protein
VLVASEVDQSSLAGGTGLPVLLGLVGGGEPFEGVDGGALAFVVACGSVAFGGDVSVDG